MTGQRNRAHEVLNRKSKLTMAMAMAMAMAMTMTMVWLLHLGLRISAESPIRQPGIKPMRIFYITTFGPSMSTLNQSFERIDLRTLLEIKALIVRAASTTEVSLSAFLIACAQDRVSFHNFEI